MTMIAILGWPIVTLILFATLGSARGLIWSVVLGYLLLPQYVPIYFDIDFPGLPPINRHSIVPLSLLLAWVVFRRRTIGEPVLKRDKDPLFQALFWTLLGSLLLAPIGTVLTNLTPLAYDQNVRPALGLSDIRSQLIESLFLFVPYFMAMRFLRAPEHQAELLKVFTYCGVLYAGFVLIEARLSPQFHIWVYGYFPHTWGQHVRGGGFRPVVFLDHGLSIGFLLFSLVVAALALARQAVGGSGRLFYLSVAVMFVLVLALSKNTGALILAALFAPLVFLATRRLQIRISVLILAIFLGYPALRQANVLPVEDIVVAVEERINPSRAASLSVRFENEAILLEHALKKPVFGWGGWSRWRVYDDRGRDTVIADGLWTITLGERGWVGYISTFGLMTLPLFLLVRARRKKNMPVTITGMALITAGNLVYLIPNSTLSPIAFLMAGALAAFVQIRRGEESPAPDPLGPAPSSRRATREPVAQRMPAYTRFEVRKGTSAREQNSRATDSAARRDTPSDIGQILKREL